MLSRAPPTEARPRILAAAAAEEGGFVAVAVLKSTTAPWRLLICAALKCPKTCGELDFPAGVAAAAGPGVPLNVVLRVFIVIDRSEFPINKLLFSFVNSELSVNLSKFCAFEVIFRAVVGVLKLCVQKLVTA